MRKEAEGGSGSATARRAIVARGDRRVRHGRARRRRRRAGRRRLRRPAANSRRGRAEPGRQAGAVRARRRRGERRGDRRRDRRSPRRDGATIVAGLVHRREFRRRAATIRSDGSRRRAIAREAARKIADLSPSWAEAAARLALAGRPPRVAGAAMQDEVGQLALAVSRAGIALVADMRVARDGPNPAGAVRALEWIAGNARCAAIALFPELPEPAPPFDRILYGARRAAAMEDAGSGLVEVEEGDAAPWIAPWRGKPHPLSDVEQRLARRARSRFRARAAVRVQRRRRDGARLAAEGRPAVARGPARRRDRRLGRSRQSRGVHL